MCSSDLVGAGCGGMPGTVGRGGVTVPASSTGGCPVHRPGSDRMGPRASAYVRGMSLPSRAEVVVVGAGLAGLSVATRLAAAGRDVHLVDAADHVGGRLTTTRVDGFTVDRGFQVLSTGYRRVAEEALRAAPRWRRPGRSTSGRRSPARTACR